jgi:hypothetical protein
MGSHGVCAGLFSLQASICSNFVACYFGSVLGELAHSCVVSNVQHCSRVSVLLISKRAPLYSTRLYTK